jgi:Asp-tRNA(Asn)/Glu-tRNA(Gln) amidotransferase A subunit family amidase
VLGLPFNWDVNDGIGSTSVAYLEDAFADDPRKGADWSANDQRALDRMRAIGIDLTPVQTPLRDFSTNPLRPLSAESAAAFDEFLREGRETELGRPGRGSGWRVGYTVPAVEYLQAQRVRGLMMQQLVEALGDFDVYVVPYGDARRSLGERPPGGGGGGGGGGAGAAPIRRSATSQFFQLANHATLPAVAVRNGFGNDGLPTGMIFVSKPFAETKALMVAKAYQDATDFHRRTPSLG